MLSLSWFPRLRRFRPVGSSHAAVRHSSQPAWRDRDRITLPWQVRLTARIVPNRPGLQIDRLNQPWGVLHGENH
jgi:hypothetical protein